MDGSTPEVLIGRAQLSLMATQEGNALASIGPGRFDAGNLADTFLNEKIVLVGVLLFCNMNASGLVDRLCSNTLVHRTLETILLYSRPAVD